MNLPRLIRLKDAPAYSGIDRNKFNAEFRPYLVEIPLGKQAIAFDRLELDDLIDHYIACNGRRPKASILEDDVCLKYDGKTKCQDSDCGKMVSGTLKNAVKRPKTVGSVKAREHLAEQKLKMS
ncbi:hypothetical protein NBRC116591_21530 [Sessilibacter corallicola]|uniref:Uncharacterized protein n=1 Tax=Sessilibacter corallicola TaxID=2904075 RepID=A0ABQ0A9L6_9GAMM